MVTNTLKYCSITFCPIVALKVETLLSISFSIDARANTNAVEFTALISAMPDATLLIALRNVRFTLFSKALTRADPKSPSNTSLAADNALVTALVTEVLSALDSFPQE